MSAILCFPAPGPFEYYDLFSVTCGVLTPGSDLPSDADGVNIFHFGGGYEYSQEWCEDRCEAVSACNMRAVYTADLLFV